MKKLRLLEAVEATSTTRVVPNQKSYSRNLPAVRSRRCGSCRCAVHCGRGLNGRCQTSHASVCICTNHRKPTKPQRIFKGKLSEVNDSVVESDFRIAEMIRNGEIDGIIVMSADPVKANRAVFAAAVEMKTPIVGTGGTSMALVAAKGQMSSQPRARREPPAEPAQSPSSHHCVSTGALNINHSWAALLLHRAVLEKACLSASIFAAL